MKEAAQCGTWILLRAAVLCVCVCGPHELILRHGLGVLWGPHFLITYSRTIKLPFPFTTYGFREPTKTRL